MNPFRPPGILYLLALVPVAGCVPESAEQAAAEWPLSEVAEAAEAPMDVDSVFAAGHVPGDPSLTGSQAADSSVVRPVTTGRSEVASEPVGDGAEDSAGPSSEEILAMRRETIEQIAAARERIPATEPRSDFEGARFPRPAHVRGLYANAWASGSGGRMSELFEVARTTEINTIVVDIKDATGYVSHDTEVPLAREIGATDEIRIRDLPALLDRFEAEGVYPIARIVVVKDPLLAAGRPDYAVQDTAGGVWIDSKDIIWLNLYDQRVWEYHVALAREVAEMGFPEIQWDYIRFPDAPVSDMERAVFTGREGRPRVEAVRGFLAYAREELADLPVRTTADVFGVTTSFSRDVGIGQLWETFIDVVDVALPMVYPSHYWEHSFGYDHPNAYPYEVVRAALRDALRRSGRVDGAGSVRPWIQDFSLGEPLYGAPEVRAQIQAAYDVGIEEWILWNPSTRYSLGALEPAGGFQAEPLVRVAGLLAPVSHRMTVMDSVAALPPAPAEVVGPSADGGMPVSGGSDGAVDTSVVPDSAAVLDSAAVADTLRPDTLRPDTLRPDTLRPDTTALRPRDDREL